MPFLPSLTDGALLRPTWHLFQVHTQHIAAAAHTHIHTLHVRTTFSVKEGIAFGSPLQGYCCSWPQRFRHLMSRPQYAIKTPRMRRPPDSKYPTNVLPILRNTNLKKLRWQTFHCMVAAFVHQTKFFFFHSGMPFSQWRIRLRLASSFPVPYILSNSCLEE